MNMLVHECPNCGAPIKKGARQCDYCHSEFSWDGDILQLVKGESIALMPDFGVNSTWPIYVALIGAAVFYTIGWTMEDTEFLLAPGATLVWGVLIPIWMAISSFI
ncbi:MAG: zinc ribbon domain-containing protein, partial [Chloroflexota bacterium]